MAQMPQIVTAPPVPHGHKKRFVLFVVYEDDRSRYYDASDSERAAREDARKASLGQLRGKLANVREVYLVDNVDAEYPRVIDVLRQGVLVPWSAVETPKKTPAQLNRDIAEALHRHVRRSSRR